MPLILYAISDGPPSLAVKMALKALDLDYTEVPMNYGTGDHLTADYEKKNPQREIPVLDDNGFYLGESNAILQYLLDKYAPNNELYPKEPQARAIVNHRLCFNMSIYYKHIGEYALAPIFFDIERTPLRLKMVHLSLGYFNTYLERLGTKYAAADHLTIADFQLIVSTIALEAINFDISAYPLIAKWYTTFKKEYPELWAIAEKGLNEHIEYTKNPPDLSGLNHPFLPIKKK